jgi:hypothetical protein
MASEAIDSPNPATQRTHCRPFSLADAMILIAGTTLFFSMGFYLFAYLIEMLVSLCRKTVEHRSDLLEHWPIFWAEIRLSFINSISYFNQILRNLLVSMVLTFIILRWRRPRPSLRTMLRQSGTLAAVAMVFGMFWVIGTLDYLFYPTIEPNLAAGLGIGGTVVFAWVILALSARWQGEPGWIDRMGRWLGVAAVIHMVLGILQYQVIPRFW